MQNKDKNKFSQTSPEVNKQKSLKQIIHESPNIEMLKKMFSRSKNKSQYIPNQQSLLFNRYNSLSMVKAYRNRKKVMIKESLNDRQFYLDKNINNSTIDSPQKVDLNINSKKYDFQNNTIDQDLYTQIIKKIQQINKKQSILPQIKSKRSKNNEKIQNKSLQNLTKVEIQNQKEPAIYLPSLKQTIQVPNQKFQNNSIKAYIKNQQTNSKISFNHFQLYKITKIKNSQNKNQERKIFLMKKMMRSSLQNPQIHEKIKIQAPLSTYGTISECKLSKQNNTIQKNKETIISKQISKQNILPVLKQVKSIRSLKFQSQHIQKGYMSFHFQAKQIIKENRGKWNQDPKIKDFMITGITATSFSVIDFQTYTLIASRNFNKKIQIASITKVMTCYMCLLACKKYQINIKTHTVRITQLSAQMNGTSAQLQIGDVVTLEDLLYGLMLPSGNDASVAIAQAIGKIIQRHKKKQTKKTYYETFIAHMNMLSRQLKIDQQWKNSSGLPQNPNHSTPHAINVLTIAAMMENKFREIVSSKQYEVTIKNERFGLKRKLIWKNTNKLLQDGWQGVKTGTTDSAGHCLMAKKGRYLISVFDSKTLSKRFTECVQLYDFVKSRERYLFPQNWN